MKLPPKPLIDPVIEVYKRDVDRTLLRENLRRTVEERLRANVEALIAGNGIRRAMRAAEDT